jgi:GNAT superfamily N-acetyltransferase
MPYVVPLDGGYAISDDIGRLDRDVIHRYIAEGSYWAKGRDRALMDRTIDRSLCLGVYAPDGSQAGFARLTTDRTTSAHLADVFILPAHRGRGLSKALMRAILAHPEMQTVSRWTLSTSDAHALYAQFGFGPHEDISTQMWRMRRPGSP